MVIMYHKIASFWGPRFWRDLEGGLDSFSEAQNLDFRIFFDDFSKQILEDVLERPKIEKKSVHVGL